MKSRNSTVNTTYAARDAANALVWTNRFLRESMGKSRYCLKLFARRNGEAICVLRGVEPHTNINAPNRKYYSL